MGNYSCRWPADAKEYDQLALNMLSGHGFSRAPTAPYPLDNFRLPLYPLSLATFYELFGYQPAIILFLQVLMDVVTVVLVFFIGSGIGGTEAGLLAAALLAVSPHSITYTALLWSETEYTLVLTLSILCTLMMFTRLELKWILLSGLSLGLATLIHPRGLYLPLILALILLITRLKQTSLKHSLLSIILFLVIFNLVLVPWRVRNYRIFGVANLTSAPGINMLYYGAALTEAVQTGVDQWSLQDQYTAEVRRTSSTPLNEAEFAQAAFQVGLSKILQNPVIYLKVHLIGSAKTLLPGTFTINTLLTGQTNQAMAANYGVLISESLNQHTLFQALTLFPPLVWGYIGFDIFYLGCIYLLSFYAVVKYYKSLSVWLLVIVILYLVVVVGPAGTPRFRVAFMPLLSVLAASALLALVQAIKLRLVSERVMGRVGLGSRPDSA